MYSKSGDSERAREPERLEDSEDDEDDEDDSSSELSSA